VLDDGLHKVCNIAEVHGSLMCPPPPIFFSVLLILSYRFKPQPVVNLQALCLHYTCRMKISRGHCE
jgi:hypothetical protein